MLLHVQVILVYQKIIKFKNYLKNMIKIKMGNKLKNIIIFSFLTPSDFLDFYEDASRTKKSTVW